MVKRYCDMCGKEINSLGFLTVAIEGYGITTSLSGQMREKEICEDCAVKVRDFILGKGVVRREQSVGDRPRK